jgi:aminoglycoside phosphotransferase family enzyme/predicted kinase
MDLEHLIGALSDASAYPSHVEKIEVRHTHISVVFLAGPHVYKIKKPVALGFLDFSTLEKRRHFCDQEVRLNRRLAPTVYHGVVAVVHTPAGVRVEGRGDVVEWAVKMARLPEDATLEKRLQRGEVDQALVAALAERVAAFHLHAASGENIAAFGRFDVVARNARENFEQAEPQVGGTLSRALFDRLRALTEDALGRLRPLIEERAVQGLSRDTHGDLHLDHVYSLAERQPPDDLVIIDCIEFNDRFRFADPVADMAFLVMDFAFHGRRDLAQVFADAYFRASKDEQGRALLPFYTAYRAAVRGKVEGFELAEKEVPAAERTAALTRARAHWLLALGELDRPGRRPCLVLAGGLPGTGKSTLARGLVEHAAFSLIRSDAVRKELAGLSDDKPARSSFSEGIYTPEWTERTYAECLLRTERQLFEGSRVVVDAGFRAERRRREFLDLAARLAVPAVFIVCKAEPEEARRRLNERQGDASDADWAVYRQAAQQWEEPSAVVRQVLWPVHTGGTSEQVLGNVRQRLRELALTD